MASGQNRAISRSIQVLFGPGASGGSTDAELVDRYLARAGESAEAAFESLVIRHGPMVLEVCRAVLNDLHDAQDAFQATFLVLAQKMASIRRRDSLSSWLYGVARRVALRANSDAARRRAHERKASISEGAADCKRWGEREGVSELLEEIGSLPEKYRELVILCYLRGLTYEEAAESLRCPLGTVSIRLKRAREKLRVRLLRRGIMLSGQFPLADVSVRPILPPALVESTVRAAAQLVSGEAVNSAAAALAEGVLMTFYLSRLKWISAATLAFGIMASGAIVLAQRETKSSKRAADPAPRAGVSKSLAEAVNVGYGDGKPDGKKSLGGSGEVIEFTLPAEGLAIAGVKIHGSRYGMPEAPDERFLIYLLNDDLSEVVSTQMAPYSLFERGEDRWVKITFPTPVKSPKHFWVALDFRAHATKGVYVSFDKSTGGKHSRVGLPGIPLRKIDFGGDWMISVTTSPTQ